MDFVPFTIIFMACLMVFQGNLASPFGCRESREWPEGCPDLQTYCFDKPGDYPSTPELKKMLDYSGFNISELETPKPIHRSSTCRHYDTVKPIYIIKGANNDVRYVVQDPNLVTQIVSLKPCKPQVDPDPRTTCEEDLAPFELLVITCDGKGVEKINHRTPVGCSLRQVNDYDYDD